MMGDRSILLDTNVLLDATRPERDRHRAAQAVLNDWPNQGIRLCTSGQILREYLVVATRNPEQNGLGLSVGDALANVSALAERCRFLPEGPEVSERLQSLVRTVDCSGKQIHDANVVATALAHGIPAIVTANPGDFDRFESYLEVMELASEAI